MDPFYSDKNAVAYADATHQAKVEIIKSRLRREYEHNPALVSKEFVALNLRSEALMERESKIGYAVTINPMNFTNLEEFLNDFVYHFQKYMNKKARIKEYSFYIERAPKTKRLHIHGTVSIRDKKTITYPYQVKNMIFASIPKEVANLMSEKHVNIEPIYSKKKWDQYCSKDPVMTFSSEHQINFEISKIKKFY